jgi:hypothetical protein
MNRARDVSFALDQVLAGELAARIDPLRIAAAGHSYGANTTLLAAGAQVVREGRAMNFADARIRAAVVISAPPFYGEADPQAILQHVRVPTLHITSTADDIRIPGYYSGVDDRTAVFASTGSARKALAVFKDGSHSMFTDRLGTGGAAAGIRRSKPPHASWRWTFCAQYLKASPPGLSRPRPGIRRCCSALSTATEASTRWRKLFAQARAIVSGWQCRRRHHQVCLR